MFLNVGCLAVAAVKACLRVGDISELVTMTVRFINYQERLTSMKAGCSFGSTVSVAAFLHVFLALRSVGNQLLKRTCFYYFHDFLSLSEAASAKSADVHVVVVRFLGADCQKDK